MGLEKTGHTDRKESTLVLHVNVIISIGQIKNYG